MDLAREQLRQTGQPPVLPAAVRVSFPSLPRGLSQRELGADSPASLRGDTWLFAGENRGASLTLSSGRSVGEEATGSNVQRVQIDKETTGTMFEVTRLNTTNLILVWHKESDGRITTFRLAGHNMPAEELLALARSAQYEKAANR